jgi:hypothetical protein
LPGFVVGHKKMRDIAIEKIEVNDTGQLLVVPCIAPGEDYRFIYRDASFVRWNDKLRCLYTTPEMGPYGVIKQFTQIISAVKDEYGDNLLITETTQLVNVPSNIEDELRKTNNA